MLGIGVGTGRQGGCVYEAILMGSPFGLSPRPAFPGVHSRRLPPWFQGRIGLQSHLPEIPLQHALGSKQPQVVQEYLAKECRVGRVLDPLLPAHSLRCTPAALGDPQGVNKDMAPHLGHVLAREDER